MKILTLNTWQERGPWRERWEVTFKGFEIFRPDLAAFQEVFEKYSSSPEASPARRESDLLKAGKDDGVFYGISY